MQRRHISALGVQEEPLQAYLQKRGAAARLRHHVMADHTELTLVSRRPRRRPCKAVLWMCQRFTLELDQKSWTGFRIHHPNQSLSEQWVEMLERGHSGASLKVCWRPSRPRLTHPRHVPTAMIITRPCFRIISKTSRLAFSFGSGTLELGTAIKIHAL